MVVTVSELQDLLQEIAEDAQIQIIDLAGDGDHYRAEITSAIFNGKSKIAQHKLVYERLGKKMGQELHALQIKTIPTDK